MQFSFDNMMPDLDVFIDYIIDTLCIYIYIYISPYCKPMPVMFQVCVGVQGGKPSIIYPVCKYHFFFNGGAVNQPGLPHPHPPKSDGRRCGGAVVVVVVIVVPLVLPHCSSILFIYMNAIKLVRSLPPIRHILRPNGGRSTALLSL